MARVRTIQASFVSGEFDPRLQGRIDIEDYRQAADKLRNVYVHPQGGAFRREGLEYYAGINGDNVSKIIPFQFNDAQTYVLAFQAGRMDVYRTDTKALQATITASPVSNITEPMLYEMKWTQSADTLILFHKDLQPIKITRTSHTSWTATNISFSNIPPFAYGSLTTSNPAGSIKPDVTSGLVTVTASGTPFLSSHVGQFINTPKGGRILIKEFVSSSEVNGIVRLELAGTHSISSGEWELETGYEPVISASRGWVRSGTFHKGRLILAGLGSRPQTILMSKIGDFFNLDIGEGLADEAIDITIDDDKVNVIQGVFSGRGLHIFTTGGEFSLRSSINASITPENVADQLQKETRHGASIVSPVSVDGAVVFVEGEDPNDVTKGRIVRQFVFNDTEQSFNANNISIFSQHLLSNPKSMDIRRSTATHPSNYLYAVNDDGTCAVLNSLREQNLLAWSLFETQGEFEDVCVSGNKTFFVVKRTIDSANKRFLEVLNTDHFLDCSIRTDNGSETTSWSGLSHLNNEEVRVRGDNYVLDNETVSGGGITSSESVSVLEAGFNFAARVKSLPIDLIITRESFAGQYKSLVSANINLYESRNIVVKSKGIEYRPAFRVFGDDVLDDPIQNVTDWEKVYIGGVGRDIEVEITQDEPLEFNILSVHYEVRV